MAAAVARRSATRKEHVPRSRSWRNGAEVVHQEEEHNDLQEEEHDALQEEEHDDDDQLKTTMVTRANNFRRCYEARKRASPI